MLKDVVNKSESLPHGSKLMVLGAGFSGKHLVSLAKALGTHVLCSRKTEGFQGADFLFDSNTKTIPLEDIFNNVTHLISCIPPDKNGKDPVIKCLKKQLKNMPLKWVGYMSTTGVYGDCKGEWVKESDAPNPEQTRSKRRLACEQEWESMNLPLQILRLPGIYGPGRSAIEIIRSGKNKMVKKEGQIFSRVHVDDIAGAIFHLIKLSESNVRPKIINIADNLPSSNLDVLRFAASILQTKLADEIPFDLASKDMSEMALSFWKENRRVCNKLLCEELGYSLIHPNYQSGLKDCLKSESKFND